MTTQEPQVSQARQMLSEQNAVVASPAPPQPAAPVQDPPVPEAPAAPLPAMDGPTYLQLLPDTAAARLQAVRYYRAWLKNEARRHSSTYSETARRAFIEQALRPAQMGRRTIMPFAPVQRTFSAFTTFSIGQRIAALALVALVVAGLYGAGVTTLITLLTLITFMYLVSITITAITAARVIDASPEEHFDDELLADLGDADWPTYTILCPLYHEVAVVPQFVTAMQAIDYPPDRLQILFLTESDDEATRQALSAMNLPPPFEIVTVPDGQPRTKPRACNYGLLMAKGSFTVIYDAEDIPDPLQLKKALLAFANHGASMACVQAKLSFYNTRQNLLTRWFAIEYALWFSITLPGLQWGHLSLPLGGTSNHFRTDVLRRLGGWDAFNVTEDCDLGLRLVELRLHTTILDSTTREEANSNVRNWIRQRSRWIKGYMQTYLVHLRHPWRYFTRRKPRLRTLFSLFAIIGGTPTTFLVNPLMWALLATYVIGRRTFAAEFHVLYIAPIFYPAVLCLIMGNFLYLYLYLLACAKSQQYGLVLWVFTMPAYWLLMCVAAVLAFIQLLFKPHYWEKTDHGFHLKQAMPAGPPASPAAPPAPADLPAASEPASETAAAQIPRR